MEEVFHGSTFAEYKEYLNIVKSNNYKIKDAYNLLDDDDEQINMVLQDNDLSPREIIEIIALCRRSNYKKTAGGANKAAENETDRLYAKNPWKFVEEFLQNADDCNYSETPQIDIIIDEKDKRHPFIEFTYNEDGFSRSDIWAITAFSESTKVNDTVDKQVEEGVFYKEKTGRKGKGFKAVFSLNAENIVVHIRSNGFSFKLDNHIGRIMPIWENDPDRMDKKTHVIVEIINPNFEQTSVEDIYPEFKRLFCVENRENIFSNSPFLFMHRMKSIHIMRVNNDGEEDFITEYQERKERTLYKNEIELNHSKVLLAGIANKGRYYAEQFQEGNITTLVGNEVYDIPVIRYTRMVEDDNSYRNYSIIAPIMTADSEVVWSVGALFRTFPMSLHPINMPLAIDAPFILNPDRSGIQYTFKAEDGSDVLADEWNTEVSKNLFKEDGVLETFFMWIRTIRDIRIDYYMKQEEVTLFDDQNNSDGHGKTWVPIVKLSELCHKFPVFKLFASEDAYVSFDKAQTVKKELFAWPHVKTLFSLIIGKNYEEYILSDIYIGSSLFNAKPIVKPGFADAINKYLDEVENELGLASNDMYVFVNTYLYPYLKDNYKLISQTDSEAFKSMKIYFSKIQDGNKLIVAREAFDSEIKWFYAGNNPVKTSINRYRVFESSPVNNVLIKQITEEVFGQKSLYLQFGEKNQHLVAKKCRSWDQIRDYIEAVRHFGFESINLKFEHLNKYVISKSLDAGFNAFRDAEVLEIIPDEDIYRLSKYFGSIEKTIESLRKMGLKQNRDYFIHAGSYLDFGPDTIKILESDKCPDDVLDDICQVKSYNKKDINTTYDILQNVQEKVLLFFLDEDKGLFTTDSYTNICDSVQEINDYWDRTDDDAKEILIRACAGATKAITRKGSRVLSISIKTVLIRKLEKSIMAILRKNSIGKIQVKNDDLFEQIQNEEIISLLRMLKPNETNFANAYFGGNMKQYGGENLYLQDGKGGNVYLHIDENGDYKSSLAAYADEEFDPETLKYIDEMEIQYQSAKENIIVPIFNKTGHDWGKTYDEVERRFNPENKKETISILSYFRHSGYNHGFGNGNLNNEKEIEDDYRNDPWKFIYEFIQNVDDCAFADRKPELTIDIRENDRIIFEYNESGFTLDDIKALTNFGGSNKKGVLETLENMDGLFDREKTGRKGRGFKSVFALPGNGIIVHICSNGYSFKFVKRLGSIIPIWEDVNDAPEIGTRIIVEGFEADYTDNLINSVKSMFGVADLSLFYSVCPILYLRKLNKIKVCCGADSFAIDMESINKEFDGTFFEANENVRAGIIHDGKLRSELWERLQLSITVNGKHNKTEAVRFSRAFLIENITRVGSVLSPIINTCSDIKFEKGALFRTLPLDEHIISIPLAINAPFDTNSGRSAIEDSEGINNEIICFLKEELLPGFYKHLRYEEDIKIEKYIPSAQDNLFGNYKKVKPLNLQSIVRKIPILKSYSKEDFVACNNAKVLLKECYDWIEPLTLSECFDHSECILVEEQYASLHIAKFMIDFRNEEFVDSINEYLNNIYANEKEIFELLHSKIYPYIDRYYDDIARRYREVEQQAALKNMEIFAFEMADGSIVREPADNRIFWMIGEPEGYCSFGKFRCLGTSSLGDKLDKYKWIKALHEVIPFDKAFTSERLSSSRIKDWTSTKELIETILYYNIDKNIRIPFLSNCVFSEEIDHGDNMFRDGYVETADDDILNHVIDIDDLCEILETSGAQDEISLEELAEKIGQMGLKSSRDFFDDGSKGIFDLNKSTLSLLRSYCTDRDKSEIVIEKIGEAFGNIRKGQHAQLRIAYEDIEDCHESVYGIIFAHELLSGEIQSNFANDFCSKFEDNESLDYYEAYLRALNIVGKIDREKFITIGLTEILRRGLGQCIQNCKLTNNSELHIQIEMDIEFDEYPSKEIDQALRWLTDDGDNNAVSVSYEYYTADISRAFGLGKDDAVCFIYDDEKVILNSKSAPNSMLSFVQKRYKGKDASFSALVSIISEQNVLKGEWCKSKKEYIEKLAKFRRETWQKQEVLFPDYDKNLNDANGKALDYVLPELLQNINDCVKGEGQKTRILNVAVDTSNGTMLLQYDERGFEFENVYSITAIGQSTKHDESEGEKGLGFKKVFALFDVVEIYSNGFRFKLSADKCRGTFPEWIADRENDKKYYISGKTTMIFTTSRKKEKELEDILTKWRKLMDGEYVGSPISPLFLKNIDQIYLAGYDKHYSRETMIQEFISIQVPLLTYYEKMLLDNEVDEAEEIVGLLRSKLKTRRKCKLLSEDEKNNYIDSLMVELCIPKKVGKYVGKGCFYSTLPIECSLNATVFLNAPLELTTGRDGIVDSSCFNEAVMNTLFNPIECGCALFYNLLENIARENKDLSVIDYIVGNLGALVSTISDVSKAEENTIKGAFESLRIFRAYKSEKMVSLKESYSVDGIVCMYVAEMDNCKNDIDEWVQNHCDKVEKRSLILGETRESSARLEDFSNAVNTEKGYFPIKDRNRDLAIEYLMDEYGYVGGDNDGE